MKKNQKKKLQENEQGIISVVQSPEAEENKPESNEESNNIEEHGIISIVQSPDRNTTQRSSILPRISFGAIHV